MPKKLGSGSNKVVIGRYNSASAHTIDIRSKIANYNDLTISDFYICNVSVEWSAGSMPDSANNAAILKSYNKESGILTLAQSGSYSAASGTSYRYYANYDVVAIY